MPSKAIQTLLIGSRERFLLLDANLLLLWITIRYDLRLLRTFKRIQGFTQDDAILLSWLVDQFKGIATTAHVVTEVSNLANSLSSQTRLEWFDNLAQFSSEALEDTQSLRILAARPEFIRFGIADCAIAAHMGTYQLLTTDFRLSNFMRSSAGTALNFDDLRRMV